MLFSKIFQILFIVGSTSSLLILPVCLNNSWWCFSSSFEDRTRFFSQSFSILFKIRDSILLPSSHNYLRLWDILFINPVQIQESFQFDSLKAIISGLFILSLQLSLSNFTGVSLKWSLIGSWSLRSLLYKFPSSIFICSLILPGASLFFFFIHFQFLRWFVQEFLFLRLSYQFIRCFNPTGGSSKTFSSLRYIYLNPFYENKLYAKSVACHQFNWWRIPLM